MADTGNDRIIRMNDMNGAGWTALGREGNGPNKFDRPGGLFVDAGRKIYVADSWNHRVVRMNNTTGAGWTTFGTPGSGKGQFSAPWGIFVR